MLVEMATIIPYRFAIFVGPSSVPLFWFTRRTVTYLCRNGLPETMLCMAAVATTVVTSKFDFCCRPLSAYEQAWPTRVTPLLSHARSLYGAAYAIKSIVLYQVRTLYPISSAVLYSTRYQGSVNLSSNTTDVRVRYMHVRDEYISYVAPRPRIFDIRSRSLLNLLL